MKKFAIIISCVFLLGLLAGCGTPPKFATGQSSDDNPATAARKATEDAIAALGDVPVKGLVFVVYYPKDGIDPSDPAKYSPDESKEQLAAQTVAQIAADLGAANGWARQMPKPKAPKVVAKDAVKPQKTTAKKSDKTDGDKKPVVKSADGKTSKTPTWEPKPDDEKSSGTTAAKPPVKSVAKTPEKTAPPKSTGSSNAIPNIGCRARGMTQAGTLKQGVAVLAIGGHQVNTRSARIPIYKDRYASGRRTAKEMQSVGGLKLVVVLSEMQLCFGSENESRAEDFLRGMLGNLPRGTIMLGGNSMNAPGASGKEALAGREFYNGIALKGQVVSMGIGGPIRIYANQTSEFTPIKQTVTVTGAVGNWVTNIDGAPAAKIYRKLTGMKSDEPFSRDCRHGVGVVLSSKKLYVRMIRNWVGADGKDSFGNTSQLPPGALRFDSPIVVGSQLKILYDEGTANQITNSAALGVKQSLDIAKKRKSHPALVLVSDCCTRDMRRCFFGGTDADEAKAVVAAMKPDDVPLFGFYAFGQIGPIGGIYRRMDHQFQQHTFISALLVTE